MKFCFCSSTFQVHDCGRVGPVACVPKALTQGLGFLNRLEDRLEEQSSKHVAEDCVGLDGIGTSAGGPPSRFSARDGLTIKHHLAKQRQNNVTAQDCLHLSTVRNLVHIHESRVAKWKSALDPQVPPQQSGGATQSGPKSAYWNPYQAWLHQNIPSLWKAWICFVIPALVPRLRPISSSLSRLPGSTCRKCLTAPTLPFSAAWWMSLPEVAHDLKLNNLSELW